MTRVKDRVATVAAITRIAMAGVLVVVAATLSAKATRARAASPALPSWHSFYNPWIGAINMYPGSALGGGGVVATTLPTATSTSHHCAWPDHGQPSLHTTLSIGPCSITYVRRLPAADHISILDALTRLVGPAVTGQLLQHDDTPDVALTYGVGR
jgi:hypothetical protein